MENPNNNAVENLLRIRLNKLTIDHQWFIGVDYFSASALIMCSVCKQKIRYSIHEEQTINDYVDMMINEVTKFTPCCEYQLVNGVMDK